MIAQTKDHKTTEQDCNHKLRSYEIMRTTVLSALFKSWDSFAVFLVELRIEGARRIQAAIRNVVYF